MVVFIFRKMLKNKWLIIFLTLSALLAMTMAASIPIYTNGVMQRVLISELDNYQYTPIDQQYVPSSPGEAADYNDPFNKVNKEVSRYAGNYIVNLDLTDMDRQDKASVYNTFGDAIRNSFIKKINLPILAESTKLMATDFTLNVQKQNRTAYATLRSYTGISDQIDIIDGRLPQTRSDGVIEAMVTQSALQNMRLLCGDEYPTKSGDKSYTIKVVGVFNPKSISPTIFTERPYEYTTSLFINTDVMMNNFMNNPDPDPSVKVPTVTSVQWYYVLDYNAITISSLKRVQDVTQSMQQYFSAYGNITFNIPMLMVLNGFVEKQASIGKTLLVIELPILALLGLLIYMLSSMLIEFDRNEISVLRSRGAGKFRITSVYIFEGVVIAAIGYALSPFVAKFLCMILGIPNGYLNLADRTAIQILFTPNILIYTLICAVLIIAAIALPAFFAANKDIIELKRTRGKRGGIEKWKLYCVDLILLAIAAYGVYNYTTRQATIAKVEATLLPVDPVVFGAAVLFIAGAALLFMRFYPMILMLIFKGTKRVLSSEAFASFVQVARGKNKVTFIMIFIIATLSVCLFHANSARSINTSRDQAIRYTNGADLTVMADWTQGNEYANLTGDNTGDMYVAHEPPFSKFENLDGIDTVTKVYRTDKATARFGSTNLQNVGLMGIEPQGFAKVTELRGDLTSEPYFYYLNLLLTKEDNVIISSGIADKLGVGKGDTLSLIDSYNGSSGGYIDVTVADVVDYWPTFNSKVTPMFVISNLSLLQSVAPTSWVTGPSGDLYSYKAINPYEVWFSLKPGVDAQNVINQLKTSGVPLLYATNIQTAMNSGGRSAMSMGTNGILTLGFGVIVMVFAIGFLLYWILSIKGRTLQFGILRSMGMGMSKITFTLLYEQLMITGAAIFAGIFIGGFTTQIFVRFYEVAYSSADQIPPFAVVMDPTDYVRIYSIFGVIIAASFLVLGFITLRSKINAAIKLGED